MNKQINKFFDACKIAGEDFKMGLYEFKKFTGLADGVFGTYFGLFFLAVFVIIVICLLPVYLVLSVSLRLLQLYSFVETQTEKEQQKEARMKRLEYENKVNKQQIEELQKNSGTALVSQPVKLPEPKEDKSDIVKQL